MRKAPVELPPDLPDGISDDDRAALRSLGAMARDHPGFHAGLSVAAAADDALHVEVRHEDGRAIYIVGGEETAAAPEAEPASYEEEIDDLLSGGHVIDLMTDTLVVTSDPVAIFASVGAEALWANDAFATTIPIREADRVWLVELLDEWSRGHYEVNVLPALVQHGRWHGTLTFETGDDAGLPMLVSLVAHRDERGEIEAVTMVARDLAQLHDAERRREASDSPLAALVEDADDLILVVSPDTKVLYASPAVTAMLGLDAGGLTGTDLLERVHPDDREKCDLAQLAEPDEDGVAAAIDLRLRTESGAWRIVEVISTDLTDNRAVGGIVVTARDVTERIEQVQRLADRAYTDALTLLPNRMRLLDRLGRALDGAGDLNVVTLLINIDNFRAVNQAHGHGASDEVIRQVAQRLREEFADGGFVARLRGDEFAVLLAEIDDVDGALVAADRIRARLGEPFRVGTTTVTTTARIGVAVSHAGQSAVDLLADADTAVGIARDEGGDRVEVMTADLRAATAKRRDVRDMLSRALADGDGIEVHYQPIFDLDSGDVAAAEALLRVHDDEGALLSPGSFLEAAEDTGIIRPLGQLVLDLTCRQLATWQGDSDSELPRHLSVNVSPRQLADPEFASLVGTAVEASGIAADDLSLEITEMIMIGGRGVIDDTVLALRDVGVRIGLDDFGAGQSSLGYLKRFPLDFVKIDRDLVAGTGTDESDTAIVRATVELAHNLGLVVVAVGVESAEQLEVLELLGVDQAQGFHFLPAVPADQMQARLQGRR